MAFAGEVALLRLECNSFSPEELLAALLAASRWFISSLHVASEDGGIFVAQRVFGLAGECQGVVGERTENEWGLEGFVVVGHV